MAEFLENAWNELTLVHPGRLRYLLASNASSNMRYGLGLLVALWILGLAGVQAAPILEPIPDKLVVLTFDDGKYSHYSFVRSVLKRYKFNAPFFITEGYEFATDKRAYMSWSQIGFLHQDGFEIGNHTRDHT